MEFNVPLDSSTMSNWLWTGSLGRSSPPKMYTRLSMTDTVCDDRWRRSEDANCVHVALIGAMPTVWSSLWINVLCVSII